MHTASDNSHRVFVYGSLRPGESNHGLLARAQHLGHHTTAPRFTLLDIGAYPAALDRGTTALQGDLFAVDDTTFATLDRLEDYPVLYTRRPITSRFGDVWIYLWAQPVSAHWPTVADGDWCCYRRARPVRRARGTS